MTERKLYKKFKARSMHKLNELMGYASDAGYVQVGRIMEGLDGQYHSMMEKVVIFKGERNETNSRY